MPLILAILLLLLPWRVASAAPDISTVSIGATTLTISGSGFGAHANNNPDSKPYLSTVWDNFETGSGDPTVFDRTTHGPELVVGGASQKNNSNYASRAYRYATSRAFTNVLGQSKTSAWPYNLEKGLAQPEKKIFISGWYMFPANFPLNMSKNFDVGYQLKIQGMTPYPMPSGPGGGKTYFQTRTCSPTGGPACTDENSVEILTTAEDTDLMESHGSLVGVMPLGTWHRLDIYVDLTKAENQKIHEWYIDGKKLTRDQEYYNSDALLTSAGIIDGFNLLNWAWYFAYAPPDDNDIWPVYFDDAYADLTQARVEMSASATWDATVQVAKEIQIPTAWSDTGISAAVNAGQFEPGDTAYVYVVDDTGAVSTGYQITIPGGPVSRGKVPLGDMR